MRSIEFRRYIFTSSIRLKKSVKPFSLKSQNKLFEEKVVDRGVVSNGPARTRFAPSPTGFIHLGSLRTALYNYLLAKSTGGQFLLRLEDTDQKRLVQGAEDNIYNSLKWVGLNWDEGPLVGGPYGPYKQSERSNIYSEYIETLLESGHAYRCFCSRDRLEALSASARKLYPPSLASYDRKCAHLSTEESDDRASNGLNTFVIRLKSPPKYPEFDDVLHGRVSLQTQINYANIRYDDPVLMKSDGLPTYHFANVIDDHLMKISHVIRGEEWLPSTPKHLALYSAFGWNPPKFIHIPLLTSLSDKKLSKRSGDTGILSMAERGILPEALINFVALFGWSPLRDTVGVTISEVFTLSDLVNQFTLDGLTKGNAKVDDKKLMFFNSLFFRQRLHDPARFEEIVNECHKKQIEKVKDGNDSDIPLSIIEEKEYTRQILQAFGTNNLISTQDFLNRSEYFYLLPWRSEASQKAFKQLQKDSSSKDICTKFLELVNTGDATTADWANKICDELILSNQEWSKKQIFSVLRYVLAGGIPGIAIPKIIAILGPKITKSRTTTILSEL